MRTLITVVIVLGAVPAVAQSTGASIGGTITDPSGAVVPAAAVTITHAATGRMTRLTTGPRGEYRAVALLPGDYLVAAEHPGFAGAKAGIALIVGSDVRVDLALPAGVIELQESVAASSPFVEVARSQPSSVVTSPQIQTLPVMERNFLALAQLLPGSGPVNSTVSRFAVTKFGGPADQRSGFTTLVDGGDVDDAQWGSPTINVGQDAVQEFKVFRTQFDAQYGHALNAVVSVATRSGGNRVFGSGFYFGRDDALNAKNAFAKTQLPFNDLRVGGSIGGPLARDRSHFFGAYERDATETVRLIALPEAHLLAAENGAFPAVTTDAMATARLDHRISGNQALSVRYNGEDLRADRALVSVTSDSSQVDVTNTSHSLVVEHTWTPSQRAAHALRLHFITHTLGTTARSATTAITRPAGNLGQTNRDSQLLPRTRLALSDVWYRHSGNHDVRAGGELALASHDVDFHVFEYGVFAFSTDELFNPNVATTWPTSFSQQTPTKVTYRSQEIAAFVQDDWRLRSRLQLNAGIRYDIDLNLRINDFMSRMLADPAMTGLDQFVTGDRGTDTNNLQPRIGATWDVFGTQRAVVRGGYGLYVSRNRPWYQLRSMNQFTSSVVRITEPARLRNFPDIAAVLGGRSLESFIAAGGPRQLGTVIPDDFVQPYAHNVTAGVVWRAAANATLDIDYIHSSGYHQVGSTDRNLPASGAISPANPRPVPQFAQVVMVENYSRSWYDALETQFRMRVRPRTFVQVSYTLARSYLDGVDFFLTTRGTQRTPREVGFNPSDQRHNLTAAASITLPGTIQLSGIVRLVSGSPIKVQAGEDLDGDTTVTGDLPDGVPITVGREDVAESLAAIDRYRASKRLAALDPALLQVDPFRSFDLRLSKTIAAGGNRRLELLVEGFNLTNHVNYRSPSGSQPEAGASLNTATALVRTVARDPRQIQWGARFSF